jgi:hypothetical protein
MALFLALERGAHDGQEGIVRERLFEEVDRPFLHGLHGHRHVGMAGHDDHRQE